MKRCIPLVFLLMILSGCIEYPSDRYRLLEDFQKDFPRKEISELSGEKVLTLSAAKEKALKYNPDYQSAHSAERDR